MQRKEKTVTTKEGYTIKKHTMTLQKGRFYTIEKDGINKGWYTYKELLNALSVLRLMEDKHIEFGIHNKREVVLLKAIESECRLVKDSLDNYRINKINGMTNSLFMLDMMLEPLPITCLDDVIELRKIIAFNLNIYHQHHAINFWIKGDKTWK